MTECDGLCATDECVCPSSSADPAPADERPAPVEAAPPAEAPGAGHLDIVDYGSRLWNGLRPPVRTGTEPGTIASAVRSIDWLYGEKVAAETLLQCTQEQLSEFIAEYCRLRDRVAELEHTDRAALIDSRDTWMKLAIKANQEARRRVVEQDAEIEQLRDEVTARDCRIQELEGEQR